LLFAVFNYIFIESKKRKMEDNEKSNWESFKVTGEELLEKVKEIVKEGNARRIIIKNEEDEVVVEFPMTVGAIGIVLAPLFAAVGALAALVSNCTIEVEKKGEE
jgi:hypothetical protein